MLNRVRGLFARYADRHLSVMTAGHPLPEVDGAPVGYLDTATAHGNRIRFDGWTTADQILLEWQGGQVAQRPHLRREDVDNALATGPEVGFAVEAPLFCGPYDLTLRFGSAEISCRLQDPPVKTLIRARRRLIWRFFRDLLACTPAVVSWLISRDPAHRARIKARLDLDTIPLAGPMVSELFRDPSDTDRQPATCRPVTIVLPVYNAFDLLAEVLQRVDRHTDLPWRLILIEDCSTDPRVRPFLRSWAKDRTDRVYLTENDTNLGFIKSVNSGLAKALDWGDHVILLNSDAFVPRAWSSRLVAPFETHEDVASVTPMSNDAEIFSVPAICTRTVLEPGQGDAIDAVAQRINADATLSTAPTGVGFCMALHIDYLRQVPMLDTIFGRGYGEEVDWCQKTRLLGGRHLGLPGLFVEHRGGESFGTSEKLALVQKNNALVAHRYPTYDRDVQEFIQADPLISARVALALAYVAASASEAVPVYLAHSLGGGAEHYLQNRISLDVARGVSSVILRVGGPQRFQIEVRTVAGETSGTTSDTELMARLVGILGRKRIIYSCGVGDPDAVELPSILRSLCDENTGDSIEVLFHDFFPISPSYCLLDRDRVYRGPVKSGRTDPAHIARRSDKSWVSLQDWQAAWGTLLDDATQVTVFSDDSRYQLLASYPKIEAKVQVIPHTLLAEVPALPRPGGDTCVVGVLGNIGVQKGAGVLLGLARAIQGRSDIRLALIGNIDPVYALPPSVPVHGNYHLADLPALAERYGVTCWLVPSIWPETFSYTTHECLATGLPVFTFDIGAQGDAVRKAENGHLIGFDPDQDLVKTTLKTIEDAGLLSSE